MSVEETKRFTDCFQLLDGAQLGLTFGSLSQCDPPCLGFNTHAFVWCYLWLSKADLGAVVLGVRENVLRVARRTRLAV